MSTSRILRKPVWLISMPPWRVIAALSTVYIVWGSTYLGAAYALESYPPFMLTALRLLIAIGILFTTLRLRRAAFPARRQLVNAAFTGALMFSGAGMVALGQELGVSSGLASVAVAAVVIWATIFASLFGHRPGRVEMYGLVIGIAGVALLNFEQGMQANPLGALILVIGPVIWAFGSMISNRLAMPTGIISVMFQMIGGLFALTLLSLLRGEQLPSDPSATASLALAYLGAIGTLVGFSAYMYLVRNVRPALATSYGYVNPVIAVILGISLRGESITHIGVLAMVVIISGVGLVMIGKSR